MASEMDRTRYLITGATGTIGQCVSMTLAQAGATLVLLARDTLKLRSFASTLPGGPHSTVAADVCNSDDWKRIESELRPLDGAVAAAGEIGPIGPIGDFSASDFRRTLDVNLIGVMQTISHVLPALRDSRGSIVTFSGGGATGPFIRFNAYAASKVAVARLTEQLSLELEIE
jgi:NADP-dependent 3-hydroxy acid dehydrogenase YdfG